MSATYDALVAGVGEVGGPLANVLAQSAKVARLDVDLDPGNIRARFLHICYPFQIPNFVGVTTAYAERFEANSIVIHSTVLPGTTERVQERSSVPVFYSPVRGKHHVMEEELRRYRKFLAGPAEGFDDVEAHLRSAGMVVEWMSTSAALEVAKLLETTYFGILIAWAQETQRYATKVGSNYEEVIRFVEEIQFLPSNYFPGHIGGHCVMPNIELLLSMRRSCFLECVKASNDGFAEGED